jgi:aryl-alcohol dehydrogenase-like predicted oxidoreductase
MTYRTLGRTGEQVSSIGIGGSHVGDPEKVSEPDTLRIIRAALDGGINFLDNSWDYNDGQSELRMGKALRDGYRHKAYLMTKIDGRTRQDAAKQLDESLRRLQVDHVDLLQHHEIIRFEDADRIFAPAGAMEAFVEAKEQGKLRHIGFTGHKDPRLHLYMLEVADRHGFEFDTVQLPLNVMDAHYRSFEKLVLPELVRRGIGVLGMKSMGSGVILKSNTVTAIECLHYALNLPASVVITGIDSMEILQQAFEADRAFRPLSPDAVAGLLARTAGAAARGEFELFKTSSVFDATARHPEWLGGQLEHVEQLAP